MKLNKRIGEIANVHKLKRLHLLGGETYIKQDLMNGVMDILEKNP